MRDGTLVYFTYDDLGRITHANAPGTADDSSYTYDLFGRILSTTKNGTTLTNTYDALSRLTSESNAFGTVSYGWNAAGRNSHITYPGTGLFVNYDYDILGRVKKIRENGATSGAGVLAQILYNDKGARTHLIRGNGHITTYAQDGLTASLNHDAAGTADDLNLSFEFNPAGQMTSKTRSNTSYDWDISTLEASSFMINGLNQAIDMYSGPVSYDARGNLTAHSGKSYDYDIFNNLTSVSGTGISVALDYDAKGRLSEENSANGIVQFAYAGSALIAEYDSSNTLLRRYVHGPGSDEPIAVYEGSGTASKFYMMADHQGSIIGYTDSAGTVTDKNSYSPEGVPDAANVGRFGYTGQMWLAEAELYHYKARAYDPQLGRFLQADPIGYGDGLNMYAYVGGDAVNSRDPSGLSRIRRVRPIDCPPGSGADACGQRTGGGGGGWTSYRPTLGSWSPISYGPGGTGLLGGSGPGAISVADTESPCSETQRVASQQLRNNNPRSVSSNTEGSGIIYSVAGGPLTSTPTTWGPPCGPGACAGAPTTETLGLLPSGAVTIHGFWHTHGSNPNAVFSRNDRTLGEPLHPDGLRGGMRDLSAFEGNFFIDISGDVQQYVPGTLEYGKAGVDVSHGNIANSPRVIKC